MKPRPYVQLQAIALLLIAVVALVILEEEVALKIAVALSVGLVVWVYFALRYYWLLSRYENERSGDRSSKDAVMLACLGAGLLVPGALAWAEFCLGGLSLVKPPLHGGEASIISLSVLAVPLSIFVSSALDWYLIRPFRGPARRAGMSARSP